MMGKLTTPIGNKDTGDVSCIDCGTTKTVGACTLRKVARQGFHRCLKCTVKTPEYVAAKAATAHRPEKLWGESRCTFTCTCGTLSTLSKTMAKRVEKRGFYRCVPCMIADPERQQKAKESYERTRDDPDVLAAHARGREKHKDWVANGGTEILKAGAHKLWADPDKANAMRTKIRERTRSLKWSETQKGRRADPTFRTMMSEVILKAFQDPEKKANHARAMASDGVRQRLSAASKAVWQRPGYHKKMVSEAEERWRDEHSRSRVLSGIERYQANPNTEAHTTKMRSGETRQNLRDVWNREGYREVMIAGIKALWQDPEYRVKHAEAMADPIVREKMAIARQNMPTVSSLNKTIFALLDSFSIEYTSEHPIGPWNFDVFIPSHNLLIECQGEYWHSLPRSIRNDKSKATYIERHFPELKLVTIWELEFHTPGRVERTLRKLLGLVEIESTVVPKSELILAPIDKKQAAQVYTHHYIGSIRGSSHCGLFYGSLLIGACSFGPFQRNEQTLRYGKDALELTRFCLDPQYQTKNVSSWFLSRCLKAVGKTIVTYADTTFGHDGAIYKACNFKFSHEVEPDYSYIDPEGWIIHKRTIWGRATKMGITEAEYVERNRLSKKWGGKKLCFIYQGKHTR